MERSRLAKLLISPIVAAIVLATAVAPALAAAPAQNPRGRFLGVVPHAVNGHYATPFASPAPVTYHGGRVLHTNRAHVIYWAPAGYSFPATYKSLVDRYFADVAADSGLHGNVYAVDTQYYDSSGDVAYSATFAGAIDDTDAYPQGACDAQDPSGQVCLTDDQIESEVAKVIAAQPPGAGDIYFVLTPPNVDSCFDSSGSACSFNYYCAYHSNIPPGTGPDILYVNEPYPGPGCDSGEYPNGDIADAAIDTLSHEHNETITDPDGDAWFDGSGNEIGDKCETSYGAGLGAAGSEYDQTINSDHYYMQEEWSNASSSCALDFDVPLPVASFSSSPGAPAAGQAVTFDGSASSAPQGAIASYTWDFGDGTSGSGETITHAYSAAGRYTARLTVIGADGLRATADETITVASPAEVPSCTSATVQVPAGGPSTIALPCAPAGATPSVASGPRHGRLGAVDTADGTVQYTPQKRFVGIDAFRVQATGASRAAIVSVIVKPRGGFVTRVASGLSLVLRGATQQWLAGAVRTAAVTYVAHRRGTASFLLERITGAGACRQRSASAGSDSCEPVAVAYRHNWHPGRKVVSLPALFGAGAPTRGSYRLILIFGTTDGRGSRATTSFHIG